MNGRSPSRSPGKTPGPGAATDPGVLAAAAKAAELVTDGARVGLGSGRAASAFITALAGRARRGLNVSGVPTSDASARLARSLGIPLIELDEETLLDLTVDGAVEVSPNLDLVKGRGAAFVRERIVAASSRRQVILVTPEKMVPVLCAKDPFPVEVIPMGAGLAVRRLKALGLKPILRQDPKAGGPYVSVNGNLIFDCGVSRPLAEPALARTLETAVCRIPGLVDTGLFLGTAERVLVGHPDGHVEVFKRSDLP
ncbi:MAG TPA: ribose-5-phosphate isomerase RpiA [Polyangia bacterium]|nr:ribose-5-phosphate isomerase RpiA [Polyangia bacterium]